MRKKIERILLILCVSVMAGCATTNIGAVQMGMTPYQTDALLGSRIDTYNRLGYDIIKYPYYEYGSQTDVAYAVFKNNSLVGLYNADNYQHWKENEFMRIYSDPNTPQAVRDAYKFQYEQDQANNRANMQAMAGMMMAYQMNQQPIVPAPTTQPVVFNTPRLKANCQTYYIGNTAQTNCS